jgi:hypothetical protein
MRTPSVIIVAGAMLAVTSTAIAQPPSSQAPPAADPGVAGPYAGAGVQGFYDVDARIDHIQQAISTLPPGQAHRATSQLNAIRSDLKFRKARHGGELRDWDRELISKKLDELVGQYPSLKG